MGYNLRFFMGVLRSFHGFPMLIYGCFCVGFGVGSVRIYGYLWFVYVFLLFFYGFSMLFYGFSTVFYC